MEFLKNLNLVNFNLWNICRFSYNFQKEECGRHNKMAAMLIEWFAGLSGYWWYRKRYTNRPETLSERYAPSETGIGSTGSGSGSGFGGDDIFRVGYIHSPEMPRVINHFIFLVLMANFIS